jgi:hypothetical protein
MTHLERPSRFFHGANDPSSVLGSLLNRSKDVLALFAAYARTLCRVLINSCSLSHRGDASDSSRHADRRAGCNRCV